MYNGTKEDWEAFEDAIRKSMRRGCNLWWLIAVLVVVAALVVVALVLRSAWLEPLGQ